MSGMDRLTDEAMEGRANTALSGLGPVHGKLMTEGYEGSANAVIDAADVIRELLAHRRASQAAPAPSDGLREARDAAWNDAIEAAASVYLNGANPNTWDYFSLARHEIRALRRAAPTEGEA